MRPQLALTVVTRGMVVNYVHLHPWIAMQHRIGIQSGLMIPLQVQCVKCAYVGTI